MSIRIASVLDENGEDVLAVTPQFLPLIIWWEDRPKGKAEVRCKISGGPNNEFMFESTGSVMADPVYWRRPWEKLVGFRAMSAGELFQSGFEKRVQEELMRNWMYFRLTLPNDAQVMTAEVADEFPSVPMLLNYGIGSQIEMMELHRALFTRFISWRQRLVETVWQGEFKWGADMSEELKNAIVERTVRQQFALGRHKKKNSAWGWLHSTESYEQAELDMVLKQAERVGKNYEGKGS
jgi:hypothetical protein